VDETDLQDLRQALGSGSKAVIDEMVSAANQDDEDEDQDMPNRIRIATIDNFQGEEV
jgi:hypothetical protein